jgi:hypothetical protein
VGLEMEHVHGGSTPGRQWEPESELGQPKKERAEPNHRDRRLHRTLLSQRRAHVDAIELPTHQNHTGFGVAVLNCIQELKNRPFWTAPFWSKVSSMPRALSLSLSLKEDLLNGITFDPC